MGIDIDQKLIKQAQHNLNLQYSIMKPRGLDAQEGHQEDITSRDWTHFPISCPLTCGFVPYVRENRPYFPYNVELRTQDFLAQDPQAEKFDVVLL